MNEFNYLDIFSTKNLEYLLVVVFLVVFVAGIWVMDRLTRRPPREDK
jgi:hypothetical protein